ATEDRLRKTQSDLIQASKLAALGQMSAALSHEFNQPLAALSVYSDNAASFLAQRRPDLVRDNLERISRLVHRLASLSRHLHSFARRPGEALRPVDLRDALEAVLEIMERRIAASGTRVEMSIAPEAAQVRAGDVRLQQVLMNLISNALDVIEAGAPARIAITATRHAPGQSRLCLRDWGPGVPPGVVERMFDPFFTTKGPGKGLGLGLSISYNIVRDFGGSLSVETAAEGGAVFILDLPAAPVLAEPETQ
ncbi:two-component sensor histidine kinase, partial [Thioclava sp. BHET1]